MIPISLTLQGIYSYREKPQTIDFTNLCNSSLFGIFGTVGSGKSTILEAISYALYGETERLNKREKRSYNMMNLKSNTLLIDFIFRNIKDGKEYRFVVKGKRNSKQFDDVKSYKRIAYVKEGGEWQSLQHTDAELIIGLNYDNFRRTIIIPQGKFQEFLQLGDRERTVMMKELFQLHKFDFSDKIKLLEQENNFKLNNIGGQLQQLESVSADKIIAVKEKLLSVNNELQKNTDKKTLLQQKEAELIKLKDLFDKITKVRSEFEILQKQKSSIENLKLKQKDYEYCLLNFKNKIDKLKSDTRKIKDLETNITKTRNQFEQKQEKLQLATAKFDIVQTKYIEKDKLKYEIDDYIKILNIKELQFDINKLNQRKDKGQEFIDKTVADINNLQDNQDKLKQDRANIQENEIDISLLYEVKAWFTALANIEKNKNSNDNEIKKSIDSRDKILSKINEILQKSDIVCDNIDAKTIESIFTDKLSEYEITDTNLGKQKEELQIKKELISYSENLQEGEACPICGSTHHTKKMPEKDLSLSLRNVNDQIKATKQKIKDTKDLLQKFTIEFIGYQNVIKSIENLQNEQNAINTELEQHEQSYNFEKKFSEKALNLEFEKAKEQKKILKNLDNKISQNEKLLTETQKTKDKYQQAIDEIIREIHAKTVEAETIEKQIQLSDIQLILKIENKELSKKIDDKNKEYEQIVADYEQTKNIIDKLSPEIAKLRGIIETKNKDFAALSADYETNKNVLDEELQSSKYKIVKEVEAILKEDYDIEKGNKKISEFEKNYFKIETTLNDLRKSVEGKNFEREEFIKLQSDLKETQNNIDQQHKTIGLLQKEKSDNEKKLEEKKLLQKQNKKLELRKENIQTLKNLFKANGFVNYISRVYLQNLVNTANQRFAELTQQKLRLELNETNDFEIRDYLNGGKTRSVKTLSGGQTFQASLSLALALTDNIQQHNNTGNNFFFLDEGFGSLDADSLSDVFKSLKSLRKEQRMVGVISHVEALQQEIDNYLLIKNDDANGSIVSNSWDI